MSTAREYLVSKGLAKPGRGKFSNAAKVELDRAMGQGVKFSDWPKGSVSVPARPTSKGTTVSKSSGPRRDAAGSAGESEYLSPSDFRFPEDEYYAKGSDGKRYSVRECCNACKVSLTNHHCHTPTIHGNITVTMERR